MKRINDLETALELYVADLRQEDRAPIYRVAALFESVLGAGGYNPKITGFGQFLRANGEKIPSVDHLCPYWVSAYADFLFQHFGVVRLNYSLGNLYQFWKWCREEDLLPKHCLQTPFAHIQFTDPFLWIPELRRESQQQNGGGHDFP